MPQINIRQDVNGSDDKPYPQERNFVVDAEATSLGNGAVIVTADNPENVLNHFGQVKYARREGAVSIYKDATRNTENDNIASAKAEGSVMGCDTASEEAEEAQGI